MWPVFKPLFNQKVKLLRLRISLVTVAWLKTETVNLVFSCQDKLEKNCPITEKDSASRQKGLNPGQ